MQAALPMLGRISGKRLCNEIDRILREPRSGEVFLRLQDAGRADQHSRVISCQYQAIRALGKLPRVAPSVVGMRIGLAST